MANNDMRMNISLSRENVKLLKALSTLEKRAYSKEILHMMEFYLDKNPELKKKLEEIRE